MRGKHIGVVVAEPLQEFGRPLDIGEKKGDLSGGKRDQTSGRKRLSHTANIMGFGAIPGSSIQPPDPLTGLA